MSGEHRAVRLLPLVPVVLAAAGAAWWLRGDDGPVEPVEITADAPSFTTLGELAAASDLVVHAVVVAVGDGRSITDPNRPESGIRTQLAELDVIAVLGGEQDGPVLVEQEVSLLDGTPIVVNGVAPLAAGDSGVAFLVRGTTEEFPYTALVNEQAWVPVDRTGVLRPDPTDPADPVWADWSGRTVADMSAALASSDP